MAQGVAISQRFEILRPLGEGGMGVVYEALDRERDARVALKTLLHVSPEGLARFKREFRALEGLHHRNLVHLGELFSEGDRWFFTMELVEGTDFLGHVRPWYRVASSGRHLCNDDSDIRARLAPTLDERECAHAAESARAPSSGLLVEGREPSDTPRFDEGRLRDALVELTDGLLVLHGAGRVHRDVKPSNVRVTKEGRVVILDFGLVGELEGDASLTEAGMMGTPAYMAPEQALSGTVTAAADWYSVGVVLYEALTGKLPFEGSPLSMLKQKQLQPPAPPRERVRGLPEDLERLCVDLLDIHPSRRPTGHDILRRLGAPLRSGRWTLPPRSSSRPSASLLVGRDGELAALRDAFEGSEGSALTVLVHGESGIGKTWLVSALTERLAAERDDMVVLRGKCHEREAVPYKALDDVVDHLCARLVGMSDEAVADLTPRHVSALLDAFPVLRRVPTLASDAELNTNVRALDPSELRRRAFSALRELFTRLARRMRTVIVVDDLHWADADSLALLDALFRPPAPPPVFFVATARGPAVAESIPGNVRLVQLARLSAEASRDLAQRLVDKRAANDATIAAIAIEGAGHPLFIDQLARHTSEGQVRASLKLDDVLWSRVERLAPTARKVMELVAVGATPLSHDTVAHAAGLAPSEHADAASILRAATLVRTSGARGSDTIEPYHDRVREAVLARLPAADKRTRHEQVATALERAHAPDAEALAVHWREAGNAASARRYALLAADQAWSSLAFDRAAEWYAAALSLAGHAGEREGESADRTLRIRLGDALANAGRGPLAAVEYQKAALRAEAAEALDLRRRAADQLFQCGHYDEGLAVTERVLTSVGLAIPKTPLAALVQLVFWRAVLGVRGLHYVERKAAEVPPRELMCVDACSSLATARGSSDAMLAMLFQTRALLFALRAGELQRIGAALAGEVVQSAFAGGRTWPRTQALVQRASAIAARTGNPKAIAWMTSLSGFAHYMVGKYRQARELLARGEEMLESHGDRGFELTRTQFYLTNSLWMMGELKAAAARVPLQLADADERGDRFATVNFRVGWANLTWLLADDPTAARRNIAAAMESWSKRGFHTEHQYELLATVNVELYVGDARAAHQFLVERLPSHARSHISQLQPVRIRTWHLRARCALAMAMEPNARETREAHLAVAEQMAKLIARERMEWSDPIATFVRATVAKLRGADALAIERLREAMPRFEAIDAHLEANVARYCLGRELGKAGEPLVAEALAWMTAQTVKRPDRFVAMLAPGFYA